MRRTASRSSASTAQGNGEIGFTRSGRSDAEGDVVLKNVAQILDLTWRASAQIATACFQDGADKLGFDQFAGGCAGIQIAVNGAYFYQRKLDVVNGNVLVCQAIKVFPAFQWRGVPACRLQ